MKAYVGSSLVEKETARSILNALINLGYEPTYDWTTHGKLTDLKELKECCYKEIGGVEDCDLFFMYFPARFGTHVELGIALALRKHIILVVDKENPNFINSNYEEKTFYQADNIVRFDNIADGLSHASRLINKVSSIETVLTPEQLFVFAGCVNQQVVADHTQESSDKD